MFHHLDKKCSLPQGYSPMLLRHACVSEVSGTHTTKKCEGPFGRELRASSLLLLALFLALADPCSRRQIFAQTDENLPHTSYKMIWIFSLKEEGTLSTPKGGHWDGSATPEVPHKRRSNRRRRWQPHPKQRNTISKKEEREGSTTPKKDGREAARIRRMKQHHPHDGGARRKQHHAKGEEESSRTREGRHYHPEGGGERQHQPKEAAFPFSF